MIAGNKHSSLLRKLLNYVHKKFYNIGPWIQFYKTFYRRNLQMFVISWSVCPLASLSSLDLMRASMAGAYLGKTPTQVGSGLTLDQAGKSRHGQTL